MASWLRPFPQLGLPFAGGDAFVVGMGSSLEGFNWATLGGRFTIALNNAALHVPAPSIHLYSDTNLWKRYQELEYHPRTQIVVQRGAYTEVLKTRPDLEKRLHEFKQQGKPNLLQGPREIGLYVSRTVATAGIMLAWRLGARRIFLLGVDGYRRKDGAYYADGTAKTPDRNKPQSQAETGHVLEHRHTFWVQEMARLRKLFDSESLYPGKFPGAGVYNLSPDSSIDAWPKIAPSDVLGDRLELVESS